MVSGGKAKTIRNEVIRIIHTNTGIRISVIPGARMLKMVTIRFMPVTSVPIPLMKRPIM